MSDSFIYPNGRISGQEETILSRRMWQMLMAASGEEEVLRLLGDTWYGEFLQYHSMEECFARAMERTEDELTELSEDRRLVDGILNRRDVRNARYLWKDALTDSGTGRGPIPTEKPGLIDIETLRRSVTSEEVRETLPKAFSLSLEDLLEMGPSPGAEFDRRMDRLAGKIEIDGLGSIHPDLELFARTNIEQRNFLTAGRCHLEEMPAREIGGMLLPEGFHTADEISRAYQKQELAELLYETPGMEEMSAAFREAMDNGSFLSFEKESDRRLLQLLQEAAFPVFGPTPLAAFVLRREMEIAHLKLLLAAKSAGVPEARLRSRLPRG